MRRLTFLLTVFVILATTSNAGSAQVTTGQLQGAVSAAGPDGQAFNIPGVGLKLSRAAAGSEAISALSDDEGKYRFLELPAGSYTLEASFDGFQTVVKTITITAGAAVIEDIRLELKGVSQSISVSASGSTVAQQSVAPPEMLSAPQIEAAPIGRQEFKEALPLVTGVVRTQDGDIHMKGMSESQSMLLVDSAQTVDPVTGAFAIDIPLDAIGSLDVQRTPFSAEYGGFSGGLTSIQTKAPASRWSFGLNEFNPSLRGKNGHIVGIDKAVPRIRVSGPLLANKVNFSESFVYQLRKDTVRGLAWPRNEIKEQGFNSLTNLQFIFSPRHVMAVEGHAFPLRKQHVNIKALTPQSASSDLGQRGFSVGGTDSYQTASGGVLTTLFRFTRVESFAHGQGSEDMRVTPNGLAGNHFNTWARTSNQEEGGITFEFPPEHGWGKHELKTGGHIIHRSYDGISRSRPVLLVGPDGSTAGRIDFVGGGILAADDTQGAGFFQDHWTLIDQLAVDAGLRFSGQSLGGRADFAPRVGLVYSPDKAGKTVFRAGGGVFHDRVSLLAGDFTDNPTRVITSSPPAAGSSLTPARAFRNACAKETSGGPRILSSCSDLGTTPYNVTWKVGVERELPQHLKVELGYLSSRSFRETAVNPVTLPSGPTLLLSNRGALRYHEYEATVRYHPGDRADLTVSYLHSRSRGDLNTLSNVFVPFEQPVIRPNLYANLASDVPNRLTALGLFKLPWDLTFSPAIDVHSGFRYSDVDVLQNYVGTPNSRRFPTYFTLGIKGYKEFRVHMFPKAPKVRLGLFSVNATGRQNPNDVFNNVASPFFGQFTGLAKRFNGIVLDFIH